MRGHRGLLAAVLLAPALATAEAGNALTIDVAADDPHAIIPTDPNASLVAAEDGTIRIETRADALAAAPAAGATAAGTATVETPDGTTIQAPQSGTTTVTTDETGKTTVAVKPGEEARASFGTPTRAPSQMREQTIVRDRRDPLTVISIAPKVYADVNRLDGLRRDDLAGTLGLQLDRALARPLSLVLGADVGMRDRGPGFSDETTVAPLAGLNLFVLGGNNEGLYVGGRANWAATGYDSRVSSGDRFGYGGEVGLRFVSSGGLSGGLAAGVMNLARGTVAFDQLSLGGRGGPTSRDNFGYATLQLGWGF